MMGTSRPMNKGQHRVKPCTLRSMSDVEAAWIGGIFEGEGTVRFLKDRPTIAPFAAVENTDMEVISALLRLTGVGNIVYRKPRDYGFKQTKLALVWAIQTKENVRAFFEKIAPYSMKAQTALDRWP